MVFMCTHQEGDSALLEQQALKLLHSPKKFELPASPLPASFTNSTLVFAAFVAKRRLQEALNTWPWTTHEIDHHCMLARSLKRYKAPHELMSPKLCAKNGLGLGACSCLLLARPPARAQRAALCNVARCRHATGEPPVL
jgi:hypothetical protein